VPKGELRSPETTEPSSIAPGMATHTEKGTPSAEAWFPEAGLAPRHITWLALSVSHLLDVLHELNHPEIEFVSFREHFDTGGPPGRAAMLMGPIKVRRRGRKRERLGGGKALVAPAASEDIEVPASAESDMDLWMKPGGLSSGWMPGPAWRLTLPESCLVFSFRNHNNAPTSGVRIDSPRTPVRADDKSLRCRTHKIERITGHQGENCVVRMIQHCNVLGLDHLGKVHTIAIGSV
jgi:hypothetical protein